MPEELFEKITAPSSEFLNEFVREGKSLVIYTNMWSRPAHFLIYNCKNDGGLVDILRENKIKTYQIDTEECMQEHLNNYSIQGLPTTIAFLDGLVKGSKIENIPVSEFISDVCRWYDIR